MRRQYSLAKQRMPHKLPDLSLLEGAVSEEVLNAMRVASRRLTELRIPHALVGGLAVGAHGYPRASKDVDFLVGNQAFEHHGSGIVTIAPGVPIQVGRVAVDQILPKDNEEFLVQSINVATESYGIPVVPIEALVYMKLESPRMKDSVDVVELLKVGADALSINDYLDKNARGLLEKFHKLIEEASRSDE